MQEGNPNMRVVIIGFDRNLFNPLSPVAQRAIEYGTLFGETHIIVFSMKFFNLAPIMLSPNVFVYPTNSTSKIGYIKDALIIGSRIISQIYFGQTIISVQDPFESGIVGVLLKKKTKLPLQIQIHTDIYSKHFYDGGVLNWIRFEISRWTIPHADGIRVVRKKIAKDLIKYRKIDPKKIIILPIFTDIQKIRDYPITVNLRLKYRQFESVILMASRLSAEKNIPLGIGAFKKLLEKYPNTGLIIVGQGSEELKLRALVKKLHLEKSVIFEAWQQDLSSYFKTTNVFLNTSDFEGYGMTLVEAGSVGCPVITTNVGVAQDIYEDGRNAYVCPPGDKDCLANKLLTFFMNPSIQKELGNTAREDIFKLIGPKSEYLMHYRESFDFIL